MKALLVVATIVDLVLAAFLVGISGFIFGGGPEGMRGAFGAALCWWVVFIACLGAPVLGFLLLRRGYRQAGPLAAWAPPVILATVLAVVPL
jgi:hypothetical protein